MGFIVLERWHGALGRGPDQDQIARGVWERHVSKTGVPVAIARTPGENWFDTFSAGEYHISPSAGLVDPYFQAAFGTLMVR